MDLKQSSFLPPCFWAHIIIFKRIIFPLALTAKTWSIPGASPVPCRREWRYRASICGLGLVLSTPDTLATRNGQPICCGLCGWKTWKTNSHFVLLHDLDCNVILLWGVGNFIYLLYCYAFPLPWVRKIKHFHISQNASYTFAVFHPRIQGLLHISILIIIANIFRVPIIPFTNSPMWVTVRLVPAYTNTSRTSKQQ